MSLTLDPILSDAQDNLERYPIVELMSIQPADAIPFYGEYFNTSDISENYSSLISHSSGRMILASIRNNDTIIIIYTDVERLLWVEEVLSSVFTEVTSLSICERSDGKIGVILIDKSGSNYYLKYMITTVLGDIITSPVTIETYTSPNTIDAPFSYQLQDESFLLVYSHYDGTDYSIYKRTSSDFLSWSASNSITLSGFESTYNSNHPSLIQVASNDILLFLDHVSDKSGDSIITNIYQLISSDNGVTWGVPVQLTSFIAWGSGGIKPYPALTSSNVIKLSFHETNSVLFINYDSPSWQNDCAHPEYSAGAAIHYDLVTKRLYVKQTHLTVGTKSLCGIVVINTETWEVIRNYNTGTVPAYSSYFFDFITAAGARKFRSEGKYVVSATGPHVLVINDNAETITTYSFREDALYSLSKNVDIDERTVHFDTNANVFGTWIDEINNKLYIGLADTYRWDTRIMVGWIDLTEPIDPASGTYTWNEISWITSWTEIQASALFTSTGGILVINELNRFCLYGNTTVSRYGDAKFGVYDLSSGNSIQEYSHSDFPSFPYMGIGHCVYKDNHVYGRIEYYIGHGQDVYRGLCDVNIIDETILYHRPSYAEVDQYELVDAVVLDENRIAFAALQYGIAIYNTDNDSWIIYDNETIPGFEPGSSPFIISIDYNSIDDVLYVGSRREDALFSWSGVRTVSEYGSFDQGKYMIGELIIDWDYSGPYDLSVGKLDSDFSITIDDDDILWAVWIRRDISLYSIKWDKDQAELDLTSYLVGGVNVSWDVENNGVLNFTLSYGHLFDVNNSMSTINIFSKKGRPITLRFGENIEGVNYWQNQGTFYIKTEKVSYSRGRYPTISIGCEDRVFLMEDVKIEVSEYYNELYPEDIIKDLVIGYTDLEEADISIENFDTRHEIWYQVVDKNLVDSIKDILDHFGYILRMDVDNKLTTKKVRVSTESVDHVYASDASTIIGFTPDDNYSSFINRVIVKGELRDPLEVLYAEELVGSIAGSGGWWSSGETVERVYFSEDKEKKCRSIRLEVIVSISDFEILWQESKGTEYISYYDPDELYVEITIEFPGLQAVLIGLLATVIAVGVTALWCDDDCGIYIMIFTVLMSAVGYILGQVANYEYELYGRPIGEIKQTVQAIANDEEFQAYVGLVMTAEINDEFCYSVPLCQMVADYELEIIKAQRKRISFSKVAHLQDEVGDIIEINHPYSNLPLNIFITSLKRSLRVGKSGSFIDSIEGWNL